MRKTGSPKKKYEKNKQAKSSHLKTGRLFVGVIA
jgi:hypothetical protein